MLKGIEQLYSLRTMAGEHLRQGRYSQASVYLRDILSRFQHELSHITSEEEMEKAIRELQLASHKNLSLCYLKMGRHQSCIEQCRHVLEVQPNNLKVVYRIGKAYLQLRQFDSAEHYLKRAFYLDSQEREVMKALEEIELLRQEAKKADEATRFKWTPSGMFWWMIGLLWAMMLFPYRTARSIFTSPSAKRD